MDTKVKAGIVAIAVGIVSLVLSIRAFIVDFEVWEANGGDVEVEPAPVPTWILVWMDVSFAILVLGIVWLVVALVLHKRAKTVINHEDYVDVSRRKYWLGIALIVASVLVAVVSAFLPLVQWYVDTENAGFLYIDLAFSVVSVTLLFAGAVRLIDDVVVNSYIAKAQQKAIV